MSKHTKANRNLKTAGTILIIIGAILLLFPLLNNYLLDLARESLPFKQQAINSQTPDENTSADLGAQAGTDLLPATDETAGADDLMLADKPAHLHIPAINLDLDVVYGITEQDLKKGPGFYPQSAHPSVGNVCIAGHRNAYGNPFMHLDQLIAGDQILLTYDGSEYVYEVENLFVVDEYDWSVIDPTPEPVITLTTCHPLHPVNGKYDRLIVRAAQTSPAAQ